MSLNYSKKQITQLIKDKAIEIGFSVCGVAKVDEVDKENQNAFKFWIDSEYHAKMNYLENHFEKRMNPKLLVPEAKSVISVALNYYPKEFIPQDQYQIAWYAYGLDYHDIMKEKLNNLFTYINSLTPIKGRYFCDTAPVLDRYWAWKAGLGWIGKNNQLIIPKSGPAFFLGELFISIDLEYDSPQKNKCGSCTKCIEACPTKALMSPYLLNSKLCISYHTIENKGEISTYVSSKLGQNIYGCDQCIKACPWIKFAKPHDEPRFNISGDLLKMRKEDWHTLTEEKYRVLFRKSAVKRAKYKGLYRNIQSVKQKD